MFDFTKKISILFLVIITSQSYAQNMAKSEYNKNEVTQINQETTSNNFIKDGVKRNIKGIVTDVATGEPLPGANVIIKGTTIGAATDIKGEFTIHSVPQGSYTLVVRFVGYKEKQKKIELKDQSLYVEFSLDYEVFEGEVVEVTAQAKGQMDAINQQLSSNTIKNVVSSDRLNEIPDANAAESIGRLPGVAIKRSGGEATEILIRGLSKGYTSVSIDGIKMAATSETRGVGIANISPNMLDGIELSKALTPDMDGDATAGAINFKLKQAPAKFKMNVLAEGGFNGYDNSVGNPKFDINFSNRFFDNKLGIFSQVSFFSANRGTDTFTGTYEPKTDPTEATPIQQMLVTNVGLGKHIETRDRYGFSFVADYKLANGKLFFKNFASRMISNGYDLGNSYNVNYKMMQPTASGSPGVKTDAIVTSLAGEHNILSGLLDWSVSYSYRNSETPNYWRMSPEVLSTNMSHDVLLNGNNAKGAESIPYYLDDINSDELTLRYTRHETKSTNSGELSTKINFELPFRISNVVDGKVKFGAKYSRNDRSRFDTEHIGFIRDSALRQKLKDEYSYLKWNELDQITMTTFNDPNYDTREFLGGKYKLYYPVDIELADEFMTDVKKYSTEYLSGQKDNYDNTEEYYAGYIMSEINITKQLTFIPGARFERTTHYYKSFFTRLDRDVRINEPIETQGGQEEVTSFEARENWLPMFHIIYKPVSWMNLRFAITKTLKRPGYLKLSPKSYIDVRQKRGFFSNPKLKVQEAINVDLHASFFNNYIGLLTVGGYYKQINNLIYSRNFQALSDSVAKSYSPLLKKYADIRSYTNVPGYNTWLKGLEFEWQTHFWYLPFPFNGLVLSVNYSYSQSETVIPSYRKEKLINPNTGKPYFPPRYVNEYVETKTTMPGQIDHIGNISIGYDYKDFSIRISGLFQGPTYGTNRYIVLNKVTEELLRWDVKMTQKFFSNFQIMLNFNNITNWPDRRSLEYHGFVVQHEEYGWQGSMGLRYSL